MVSGIIIATVSVAALGLFIGVFLGVAGEKFKVEVDPNEEKILSVLPGNNCGGCGYAGCSGLAAAIAKGEAPVNGCPVGGEDVGKLVGEIMGVAASEGVKMTAFVKCQGDCDKAKSDYKYTGVSSCAQLAFVPNGGPKSCNYGCLGCGDCVNVCPFDAISIVNGIAVVNEDKCKSCGKCVQTCPKNIIELVPATSKVRVFCNSKDKGPVAMKACDSACIGCGLCAKNCEFEAIEVNDFLAHIDYDKCKNCGLCATKCPKGSIINLRKK